MPPIGYPGNSISKAARAKNGGGFESAIEVAGGLQNGQTITISGTGFEAINNPLPSAVDEMNTYGSPSDGVDFPTGEALGAKWDGAPSSAGYEFDTTIKMPSRPVSARAKGKKSYLREFKTQASGPPRSASTMYSTHWMRLNESLYVPTQPDLSVSLKFGRYWGDTSGTSTRISVIARDPPRLELSGGPAADWIDNNILKEFERPIDVWHRIEVEVTPSSGSEFNCKLIIDGKKIADGNGDSSGFDPITGWSTLLIGLDPNEPERLNDTLRNWISDAYEQPSIARVELSNDPVIDTTQRQIRHYQKTISRTDTEIQFELYLGFLDKSLPLYAHVVKSDGSVISQRIN